MIDLSLPTKRLLVSSWRTMVTQPFIKHLFLTQFTGVRVLRWMFVASTLFVARPTTGAEGNFEQAIQPVLRKYCNHCHSTRLKEGELDLEQFTNSQNAASQTKIWEHVLEQLANGEMPPKDEPQLPVELKTQLTTSLQEMLDRLALASAGDPGDVVLRRLSNVEYTYTLRDLTGVTSLDPAKEFPVDGAAGEGFTNAGAALVMSPSLLTKYLDAAKDIADHAVLFAKYLAATLEHRRALAEGTSTIASVASERELNAKYLGLFWAMLNDTKLSLLFDTLRSKWRDGQLTVAEIELWQQSLWRFANIGHLGKAGGPKAWMEPVTPLVSQQEFRWKLAAPTDGKDITIYLSASDAGDGNEHDFALCVMGKCPNCCSGQTRHTFEGHAVGGSSVDQAA